MPDFWGADHASALAVLTVLAAAIWKGVLKLKADTRNDKAEGRIDSGYGQLVEQLRTEVARLSKIVREMSEELRAERAARLDAEQSARDLLARVRSLEETIRGIGAG